MDDIWELERETQLALQDLNRKLCALYPIVCITHLQCDFLVTGLRKTMVPTDRRGHGRTSITASP
jgi:hypothetical protein